MTGQGGLFRTLQHGKSDEYQAYLAEQRNRTVRKLSTIPSSELFVAVTETAPPALYPSVLCIGVRNTHEIDAFRARGYSAVSGIDLIAVRQDIKIMDMHSMSFAENSFDIVYMSHVLEHAYDPAKVAGQVLRIIRDGGIVAIEVPIRYTTGGADRIDFQDAATLIRLFEPHVGKVYISEEHQPHTPENRMGTAITRIILSVVKQDDTSKTQAI